MKKERVYARLQPEQKESLTLAANTLGISVNDFLVQSALEKTQKMMEAELTLTLSQAEREKFFKLLGSTTPPTAYLKSAAKAYLAEQQDRSEKGGSVA